MIKSTNDQELIAAAIAINAPFVGRLRSRTLVGSRWLALFGQMVTLCIVHFGFGYPLPFFACMLAISANVALNLIITLLLPPQRLVRQWEAAAQLTIDVLQLAVLLYLTGGIENPFCLLFIAPATVSAATLHPKWTIGIIAVTIICVVTISITSYPLPWNPVGGFQLPTLYRFANAFGIGIGLIFTTGYAWRVSVEQAELADALIATQEVLAREQRLAALGTLAAAAAHELGTPLATIQVASKELALSLPAGSMDKEDAELILSQAQRCREILRNLTSQREITDQSLETLPLGQFLEEIADRHPERGGKIVLFDVVGPDEEDALFVSRNPAVIYGLGNMVENAIHFAKQAVLISARWDQHTVQIIISDDGAGFHEDILSKLGQPYVTTRDAASSIGTGREGMGLGFFIAKTLLERSGGSMSYRNDTDGSGGAIVETSWPRVALEYKEPMLR